MLEELVPCHAGHPVVGDDHVDVAQQAQRKLLQRPGQSPRWSLQGFRLIYLASCSWFQAVSDSLEVWLKWMRWLTSVLGAAEDLGDDGPVDGAAVDRQDVLLL